MRLPSYRSAFLTAMSLLRVLLRADFDLHQLYTAEPDLVFIIPLCACASFLPPSLASPAAAARGCWPCWQVHRHELVPRAERRAGRHREHLLRGQMA